MSEFYTPGAEGGLPHDDPRLALPWPLPVTGDLGEGPQLPSVR